MFLKTMSTNILRATRSSITHLSFVKCSFEHYIPQKNINRNQLCYPHYNHSHCANFNNLGQSMCRTIYSSRSSILQNQIQSSIETNRDTQPRTSETNWSFASKFKNHDENEAEFYHNVLGRLSAYSGNIYKDNPQFLETYKLSDIEYKSIVDTKNWDGKTPCDIITSFISLGVYASKKQNITIEDQQFEALISALIDNLESSTDNQLIDCFIALKYWPILGSFKDPHIYKVWKGLDEVCFKRLSYWTTDKCLYIMDLWYHLGLIRNSFFVVRGLNKVSRKTEDFTAAQIIQSLFYMSCKRKLHPQVAIREYEYYIQQYITKLSIQEIGIFAIAFFKTKTKILNRKILMYLMQRTVEEAETMDLLVLTSIAKVVRFSHTPDIGFSANDMVTKVVEKRWDSFSLVTGIHLVHIGTQIQFYNEEALTKLAEKFCKDPTEARMKDMERIAFFLSLFNFVPPTTPDIFDLIVEQLNLPSREKEATLYPLFFLSLLYFLSLFRVFPEKQIRQAVNEERLIKLYENKFNIPQQAVQLDYNRVLEGPAGSEHLLPPQLREYLARRYSVYIPNEQHPVKYEFDKVLAHVMSLSDELLGKENNLVTYPLPHFPKADILFRLDDKGNPLPIPEEMRSLPQFDDVHRPIGPGKWHCVVVGGRNMYMHNVPRLVGEQVTKIRQLQSLGYTPVLIPTYYWRKEEDKISYLKLKYFADHGQNK